MKTFEQLQQKLSSIPATAAWYLADLGEAKGKQELFTKQSPQKLKVLKEHALIESAVSSNRIEGIEINESRIATVIFGQSLLQDRDEEEIRGYRDALKLIHDKSNKLPLTEKTIKEIHYLTRAKVGDAGEYKERESNIIEKYPDGRQRIRFQTVSVADTPNYLSKTIELWHQSLKENWVHPLIALAAFNLDFLCIHPFRDGNGRVSRLLLLLQCYQLGYEVGRYISIERLIEQNKERYYETLYLSSQSWHEGKADIWPFTNYLLYILKLAYQEFEKRINQTSSPKGSKRSLVESTIESYTDNFTLVELERACPGVSRDMIRTVLKSLRKAGKIECLGLGPNATWQKRE